MMLIADTRPSSDGGVTDCRSVVVEITHRIGPAPSRKKLRPASSGDGRIVVTAAKKYGVKAIGFEIDPERIKESAENIKKAGVGDLVEIRQQDIRTVDLSPATVLTMYLLPEVNLMIRPNIWKQMKAGSRVVSHDFDMGDWKPLKTEHIKDGSSWDHTLYLWHVEAGKK